MLAKLVYFRPMTIAYVRTDGQSERAIDAAWTTVRKIITHPSFEDAVDRAFGLHWKTPAGVATTAEYEAAIVYTNSVQLGRNSPFRMRTLPGGSYVRQALKSQPDVRLDEIDRMLEQWSENENFMLDPARPTIEVLKLRATSDLNSAQFELCVPVMPRPAHGEAA